MKSLQKAGHEIYHLAFGQSPFPIPDCFVNGLKEFADKNEYLPVAGLNIFANYLFQSAKLAWISFVEKTFFELCRQRSSYFIKVGPVWQKAAQ